MKRPEYDRALTVKLSQKQRAAIETLADRGELSLAKVVRLLLERGLETLK